MTSGTGKKWSFLRRASGSEEPDVPEDVKSFGLPAVLLAIEDGPHPATHAASEALHAEVVGDQKMTVSNTGTDVRGEHASAPNSVSAGNSRCACGLDLAACGACGQGYAQRPALQPQQVSQQA